MSSNLRETVFHIEKLRNIVGVGNCTAYQICTSPGRTLGRIGRIAGDELRQAANQASRAEARADRPAGGWLIRVLRALKS